jgi:hypothetical protein
MSGSLCPPDVTALKDFAEQLLPSELQSAEAALPVERKRRHG